MTLQHTEQQETEWLTKGDKEAAAFIRSWRAYVHGIDDIIDGDIKEPEQILRVFMQAAFLYAEPFYLKNLPRLYQLVINCTNAYADSVNWEKSEVEWKRNFSDHYRHFGAEMVLAIAEICGGYDHMRQVSVYLREICWNEHHNEKGEPC